MPQIKITIDPKSKKPIEYIGKVQKGWKCPRTDEVFARKDQYVKHLRVAAKHNLEARKRAKFEANRKEFWANMRATVRSASELEQFVKDNWQAFVQNAMIHARWDDKFERAAKARVKRKESADIPQLKWIKVEYLRWSDSVSNSHSCPFNGVTNWGSRVEGAPRGYPGWTGRMEYQTTDEKTSTYEFGSDMWKDTGLHTSCGGYASNYYYQFEIFAEDWPGLAAMHTFELVQK